MKAIIVDIDDENIIILNKKGDFKKINKNMSQCQIGDEIEVPDRKAFFGFPLEWPVCLLPAKKIAAVFAVLILLVGMSGYCIADYFNPVTFITMDINPSLELALNRYERVLRVDTFNDGGDVLAPDAGSFRNMKLEDALGILVDRAESKNYLNASATLMLTIASKENHVPDELDAKLKEMVLSRIEKVQDDAGTGGIQNPFAMDNPKEETGKNNVESRKPGIQVIVEKTTMEKHEEARKMNMSQGKFLMYEKLKKVNPDVTPEDVKKAPVSRIIEELNKPEAGTSEDKKMTPENKQKSIDSNERHDGKGLQKSQGPDFKENNQEGKSQSDEKGLQQGKSQSDEKGLQQDKSQSDEKDLQQDKSRQDGKLINNEKGDHNQDKIDETSKTTDESLDKLKNVQEKIENDTSATFEEVKQDLIQISNSEDDNEDNKEKGKKGVSRQKKAKGK